MWAQKIFIWVFLWNLLPKINHWKKMIKMMTNSHIWLLNPKSYYYVMRTVTILSPMNCTLLWNSAENLSYRCWMSLMILISNYSQFGHRNQQWMICLKWIVWDSINLLQTFALVDTTKDLTTSEWCCWCTKWVNMCFRLALDATWRKKDVATS